ncbi:hypothetical protein [Paenarthrobacter nitroguajacolicus]
MPPSSSNKARRQFNRYGDRQLNRALELDVLTRLVGDAADG